MIKVYSGARDEVIKSTVTVASADYEYALAELLPLLDRFGEQRKMQGKKFYTRLRKDIIAGCIMPPITLAFVNSVQSKTWDNAAITSFVNKNISEGYILDGMQRLSTLKEASTDTGFNLKRPIHINIIIAERHDLLLYRMITLNNGQKPMTARHQIEMLTKVVIDLSDFSPQVVTEKETEGTKIHGAFRKSDIVEAYIAFLTNSVNNQNSKIIESKLDEIIVGKVMDSDLSTATVSFADILGEIGRIANIEASRGWIRQVNNLIGFTVGMKESIAVLKSLGDDQLGDLVIKFDKAFEIINQSKVNVGKQRRELSSYFFKNLGKFVNSDLSEIESAFVDYTAVE